MSETNPRADIVVSTDELEMVVSCPDAVVGESLKRLAAVESDTIDVSIDTGIELSDGDTADCLIVSGEAVDEGLGTSHSVVLLYTNVEPSTLDSETLTAVDGIVRSDREASARSLFEKIVAVAENPGSFFDADHPSDQCNRYERILQGVDAPICTLDRSGRVTAVNQAFTEKLGYSSETINGQSIDLVCSEGERNDLSTTVQSLAEGREQSIALTNVSLETDSGETFPADVRLRNLPNSGTKAEIAVVVHDISRLKRREKRLSKFATVVSHDLRNPLDVALGRAEMLPEIADVDPETENHLQEIHASLKRMERLIQDVLTLTRQREKVVTTTAISLDEVVKRAWRNVDTEEGSLELQVDTQISAHESRLGRLFENLFRNAIQHGGNDITVRISTREQPEGTIEIRVADDGCGIPEKHRTDIFEDGFTTTQNGTGLGLAIVREIARAHGWTVSVRNAESGGAVFVFSGIKPVRPDEPG